MSLKQWSFNKAPRLTTASLNTQNDKHKLFKTSFCLLSSLRLLLQGEFLEGGEGAGGEEEADSDQ